MIRSSPVSRSLFLACVGWLTAAGAGPPNWTQFRGPAGDGLIDVELDLTKVGDEANLVWKTPIRGEGWSSPVSDGSALYFSSSVTTPPTATERLNALSAVQFGGMKDVAGSVELVAISLDSKTGQLRWEQSLGIVDDPKPIHPMNSYASPTPVVAGDRVVFHFGGYGTWCLDVKSGQTLWEQALVVDDSVGPGSSPVRYKDLILIACDGIDRQFVAALSLNDGSIAWKTSRPPMRATNPEFQKAYSTPLLISVGNRTQAVIPTAQWLVAYEPDTGRELWRADCGDGYSNATMPIFESGLVIYSTGFNSPQLVAVDPSGAGDVTDTHIRWRQGRHAPTKPSLASDGKHLYAISDDGILSACSPSTGRLVWRERIGGTFSSSPILSSKQGLIGNHDGTLTVFALDDHYRELKTTELREQIMASPIPVGNDIILRTRDAVRRYRTFRNEADAVADATDGT